MVPLTKLNGRTIIVNPENVDSIEATPDTTLCFTHGNRLVVRDTVKDVVQKILDYRRSLHNCRLPPPASVADGSEAVGILDDEA